MNPTRARLLDILMQMGLHISVTQMEEIHGELVGSLQVKAQPEGTTIAGADSAALIDEIPFSPRSLHSPRRELKYATPKNCASKSPIASPPSPRTSAKWAPKSKNATTA